MGIEGCCLAAVVPSDGFHAPDISELFPPAFAFQGTPFEINAVQVNRFVMLAALVVCCLLYITRAKVVPGRAQAVFESVLMFCQRDIAEEVIGTKLGRRYAPIVTGIFLLVLFMNLAGEVPGLNLAGTAIAGLPLLLAIFSWFVFVYAGISQRGGLHFLKEQLFPPGVPKLLYVMLTPIEAISTFIIRPFTLFVRLMANMLSGHFLLTLTIVGTHFFVFSALAALKPIAVLTFLAAFAFMLFEILVAFLQAYIFAILTAVYINLSVHAH